ncbi:unnamed protein product [Caenorhabditis brenneri]
MFDFSGLFHYLYDSVASIAGVKDSPPSTSNHSSINNSTSNQIIDLQFLVDYFTPGPLTATEVLIAILKSGIYGSVIAIVTWYIWNWSYWIRKGVKGPRGVPFLGVLDVLMKHEKPGLLKLGEWTKEFGKIYGITDGVHRTLVISDPTMAQEIFVRQFENFYGRKLNPLQGNPDTDSRVHLLAAHGHRWKRLRTISAQSFSQASLRKLMDTVEDSAMELLRHIEERTSGGEQIDMLEFYQEYTMDVISRIAMGQRGTRMFNNPEIDIVREIFDHTRNPILVICQVFPILGQLMRELLMANPDKAAPFKLLNLMRQRVLKRIEEREQEVQSGGELGEPQDFIDLFLDAKADVDFDKEAQEEFTKRNMKVIKQLTQDEVIGQCFLFVIGGFDTTALALSYVTYLLAMNPEIQKKLQEEVDREFGDAEIEFEKLGRLKYMDKVMKEALRLYPLASISNSRKCMKTTSVCGVQIEAGTYVQMDTWTLHQDPEIWGEDAKEFKPERWDREENLKGAYLPFGLGPRQCIGMRLAIMEQKILLTHILRKYSFERGAKTAVPLKLVGSATTSPENVYLHLRSRI